VNILRNQDKSEEMAISPKETSKAKANTANSSRQKQANANRARQDQADNSKKKNSS
jgi:hypothetical protein